MSKIPKKREQLVSTAKDLFWRFGFKRVTIEEICSKSGVSKMTFYKYFPNKTELAKTIIEGIYVESMEKYKSIINSPISYKDKISGFVNLKMEATKQISREFLNDYYSFMDEELSDFMQQKVAENLNILLNDFIKAQEEGNIRPDIKPEFIMFFLNHIVELGNNPQLNAIYPDAREMILELMNFFFYGILPRSETEKK